MEQVADRSWAPTGEVSGDRVFSAGIEPQTHPGVVFKVCVNDISIEINVIMSRMINTINEEPVSV